MRILLADHDAASWSMLETLLRGFGHRVFGARDGQTALRIARERAPLDMVLINARLQGIPGADVCRALRTPSGDRAPYLVVISDEAEPADIALAIEAGADDFLYKPIAPAEILAKLGIAQRLLALSTRLDAAAIALAQRDRHDLLTGALARATVLDRLNDLLAEGEARPLGLVLVDLDGFAAINRRYGMSAGDAVLRETAVRLGPLLPAGAFVGRAGANEFLVLLPGAEPPQVAQIANRARHAVAAAPVCIRRGSAPPCDAELCASVAYLDVAGADADVDALLRALAGGIEEAKRAGGDRTVRAGDQAKAAEQAA